MSAEAEYLKAECNNVLKTVEMVEDLLQRDKLSRYEIIAFGKLIQDTYSGIEKILRYQLEKGHIEIRKSESWHKDLILAAKGNSMVTDEQFDVFKNLLLFRHLQIHGYGFMLDEKKLRDLAKEIPKVCRDFLKRFT